MLSYRNIYEEIGRNIFIYPVDHLSIKGNSIDFTASKFAWAMEYDSKGNVTGNSIYKDGKIIIPPHTTAYIVTNESIYVTGKIGGTYHAKLGMLKKGLSNISTTLDPFYIGQSLITLHNNQQHDVKIKLNEPIVTIIFYYLSKPVKYDRINATPAHSNFINTLDSAGEYEAFLAHNQWAKVPLDIKEKCKKGKDGIKLDAYHDTFIKSTIWGHLSYHSKIYMWLLLEIITLAICYILKFDVKEILTAITIVTAALAYFGGEKK